MIIGVPKEIKNNEFRVALTPAGVYALVSAGHKVVIENGAGIGSGFEDIGYKDKGAVILTNAADVYSEADMIIKVKEPLESEYELLKDGQILFTYLHLAPNRPLTEILLKKKITAIAYETVQLPDRSLPLLTPMSEVAGRVSVQVGAELLRKHHGGSGVLLGGVPGVLPAEVVIIGGGVVGKNAAKMAVGLGASVTVLDIDFKRLAQIDDLFGGRVKTLINNRFNVEEIISSVDLLIGAVLLAGKSAPKVVTEDMVKRMKKGSVIVDVAIDQGGCIETIDRVTSHENPSYEKYGVIHYSVPNIPGSVPRTSTLALTGATMPYILSIANKGAVYALKSDAALLLGLNTFDGYLTCRGVSESLEIPYTDPAMLLI